MSENQEIKNGLVIGEYSEKKWYKDGELHRDNDMPAVIEANGNKFWIINNLPHRDNDLPAIEYYDGSKYWFQNALKHRENGLPAVIYADGTKEYWEYGEQITQEESLRRKERRELYGKLTNDFPISPKKSPLKKI